jgi:hypothetical protein
MDDLTARRLELIRTLESGRFPKARLMLYRRADNVGHVRGYCCIGVGLRIQGVRPDRLNRELDTDYNRFCDLYDTTMLLRDWLTSMNDGSRRPLRKHIFGNERSHPFIARCLRKVWGLTDA